MNQILGFIIFASTIAITTQNQSFTIEPSSWTCPPEDELRASSCVCISETKYIICDGNSASFTFKIRYQFEKLIIKNSSKLPFWKERLTEASNFKVNSLIILQNSKPVITENFNELLQLPEKSLQIVSNGQIDSLHLSFISRRVSSISISHVANLYLDDTAEFFFGFPNLRQLQLKNIQLHPTVKNLVIENVPLQLIVFSQTGLLGSFAFVPQNCPPNGEQIIIDLRGNSLEYFDFATLFTSSSNVCKYHLNLADNQWKVDLLISQLNILEMHAKNLEIQLEDAKLNCNAKLRQLSVEKMILKGIRCANYGDRYLEQIGKPEMIN